MYRILLAIIFSIICLPRITTAAETIAPVDEHLAKRLEWFRDQKFGLFMHWGAYSQLGCIESWPLVFADKKWSNPSINTFEEMLEFRKKYWAQNKTFNPTSFEPKEWAKVAKRAGMKYVMFTTKHHDGFSMFDTKQTDYRVTAPDCPYSKSAHPDIAAEVFAAFRAEGFGIGAYFSKSDWHHPSYWDPERPAKDRNPNYDTAKEPERWAKFVSFVHGQIEELMTNYGKIDILWLDGGQVRPPKQDVQMDRLAEMARRHQPDLIIVDRTARTKHENYRTPEQQVPKEPLSYTWETCMTMGDQWSFKPDDKYKSTRQLIHLLVDIVAKGGNFLLNIGPQPDGKLPAVAVQRLEEIGNWMAINAEAIHGTRTIAPYKEGRIAFTSRGNTVYAIYLPEEDKETLPEELTIPGPQPVAGSEIHLLGIAEPLKWHPGPQGTTVSIPSGVSAKPPCKHAFVFKIKQTTPASGS
ncbi:MAG: alpha-L-fucosidase [Kiritimatiellae bacterium]|nr:alpha-L-fucosidase [Kiritimatiellia bacterium]MDD5522562.1 alpha-L-fucosidase [Kiritimatiellia bacterium]